MNYFRRLRACYRFGFLLLHLLIGYVLVLLKFPFINSKQRALEVQKWAIKILHCLGIIVQVQGVFTFKGPLLIVSNHISWLDILVLHSVGYCRFVAKSEIGKWPIVGLLTSKAGMFFIERNKPKSAIRVVHTMAKALEQGDVLAIFPEGTTSDGRGLLPFHGNLMQAAVTANAPVLPLCIMYLDRASQKQSQAPSFVGDMSLVQSVWSTLCADPITAQVRAGSVQMCEQRSRKEWSEDVKLKIAEMLG